MTLNNGTLPEDALTSDFKTDVYLFRGTKEFTQIPTMKRSKFESTVKNFGDSLFEHTFSEYPVQFLSNWYNEINEFETVLKQCNYLENGKRVIWDYRLIVLNPQANPSSVSNQQKAKKMNWAQELAIDFLNSVFNSNVDDRQSIGSAVLMEFTVMIVACRRANKRILPKKLYSMYDAKDNAMVLATACFRHGTEDEVGMGFLTWMAVAQTYPNMPLGVDSWRRLGIGRFMIIIIIKRLTMALLRHKGKIETNEVLEGVEIFLQSTTPQAFQFYRSCGFKQINLRNEDNRELLPPSLQEREDGDGALLWWVSILGDDEQFPRLLYLPPGQLLKKPLTISLLDSDETASDSSKSPWCRFPASLHTNPVLRPTDSDMDKVVTGLHMLQNLLPGPLSPLLPPGSIHLHGEILMENRKVHGRMKGKAWMSTGELEMMTALLMRDGRYDDAVAIVPFALVNAIGKAFEAYKKATLVQQFKDSYLEDRKRQFDALFLEKYNANMYAVLSPVNNRFNAIRDEAHSFAIQFREETETTLPTLIETKFEAKEEEIMNSWTKHTDFVSKSILSVNPCLIQKKMIVFPQNLNDAHWMVTFVFNPSSIDKDTEYRPGLQTCFFRFCSMNTTGSRGAKISQGLLWFLNLAYCHAHRRVVNRERVVQMNWDTPFGTKLQGSLLGTKAFPSMRLKMDNVLPKQTPQDDYNCGIGVVAAIGILLCDVIGVNLDDDFKFATIFSKKTLIVSYCKNTKEYVCSFPEDTFQTLPPPHEMSVFGKTYLALLREQWFILFDRLAKMYHETLCKRLDADCILDEDYIVCCNEIAVQQWPPSVVLTKQDRSPSPNVEPPPNPPPPPEEPPPNPPSPPQEPPPPTTPPPPEEPPPNPASPPQEPPPPNPPPPPEEPPPNPPPPPEEPPTSARQIKLWEHIPTEDPTPHAKELYTWPQILKVNVARDDWDGKTKDENTWNPHWKSHCDGDPKYFFGDEVSNNQDAVPSYFAGTLTNDSVENFETQWYNEEDTKNEEGNKDVPIPELDPKKMEKFVDHSFQNWGWSSNKQFAKDLERQRQIMQIEERKAKTDRTRSMIHHYYTDLLQSMKKERRFFRKEFENNYKLGNPAAVRGLKYDQESDTFTARCVYKLFQKESNEVEEIEEIMVVSEEWVKLAGFARGVVEHVISMDSGCGFVPVPEGVEILMNTRKVLRVKYMHPTARWVLDLEAVRAKAQKLVEEEKQEMLRKIAIETGKQIDEELAFPSKRRRKCTQEKIEKDYRRKEINNMPMKEVISGGYWQVIFQDDSRPMRTDESFVKANFRDAYISELKRVKKGFVDIPVGDYKVSHLSEHPNLHVHGAPRVCFSQADGQDLCVSKSFASALYALGFEEEASRIDLYGITHLQGGAVDAFGKVMRFAKTVLPTWIITKCVKRPVDFNWKTDLHKRTILLGVLNASDGNCSHAVTLHGGFIYDANELVAIPLCQEALDYCTSTQTERSSFVNFRRIVLFYYEGQREEKVKKMSLVVETEEKYLNKKSIVGEKRKFVMQTMN